MLRRGTGLIFSAMENPEGYQRVFAELKHRHVFKVMAVYGVAGFVILQVVDLLVPALLLPPWAYRLVALILLVGFPVAVVLAWAFELTPDGVRRARPATKAEIERVVGVSASRRWPAALAAVAGLILLGLGGWWMLRDAERAERTYDSIAVLPFTNLTGDQEAEYLGDGLAEELLNALAGVPDLDVASRTAAFAFKDSDTDPRTIGDSLNVALVLEGSVRGAGDRLRITAQLIDAADGFHLWSEQYDRPRSDLLDLQEDLTARIVEALAPQLDGGGMAKLADRGTQDPAAYDLYLRGRHFWNKRTPPDMQVAIRLYERAIGLDSTYAAAYAAIAESYAVPVAWDLDGAESALNQAEHYARRALDIDPTLAQAHTALGMTYMMRDLDFRRAEASFVRAIELDGNYATAHQWFAELLSAIGRREEAVAEVRRAERLDPTPIIVWNVARVLAFAGRYQEAIEQLGGTSGIDGDGPTGGRNLWTVVQSLYFLGDFDRMAELMRRRPPAPEDRRQFDEALAVLESESATALEKRRTFLGLVTDSEADGDSDASTRSEAESRPANLGSVYYPALFWLPVEPDSALARLDRAAGDSITVDDRIEWFHVLADAAFDVLRDDPRFRELNARFGF